MLLPTTFRNNSTREREKPCAEPKSTMWTLKYWKLLRHNERSDKMRYNRIKQPPTTTAPPYILHVKIAKKKFIMWKRNRKKRHSHQTLAKLMPLRASFDSVIWIYFLIFFSSFVSFVRSPPSRLWFITHKHLYYTYCKWETFHKCYIFRLLVERKKGDPRVKWNFTPCCWCDANDNNRNFNGVLLK